MAGLGGSGVGDAIPARGLLVVTGGSHTGKTTIAKEVVTSVAPPAAYLAVDDVLERTLLQPPGLRWAQIPLAYELLGSELEILLERRWFVVLESTFTFVPPEGNPQFHSEVLAHLEGKARRLDAPVRVVQLMAPEDIVLSRARRSGRLDDKIVSATTQLHRTAKLPGSSLTIDTSRLGPTQSVAAILNWIDRGDLAAG
jgi:chloramphenicol 3-O-phosphotransferase